LIRLIVRWKHPIFRNSRVTDRSPSSPIFLGYGPLDSLLQHQRFRGRWISLTCGPVRPPRIAELLKARRPAPRVRGSHTTTTTLTRTVEKNISRTRFGFTLRVRRRRRQLGRAVGEWKRPVGRGSGGSGGVRARAAPFLVRRWRPAARAPGTRRRRHGDGGISRIRGPRASNPADSSCILSFSLFLFPGMVCVFVFLEQCWR
jgi:hypothetical protein